MAEINAIEENSELLERIKNLTTMKILSDEEFAEMIKLSKICQYLPGENIIKEKYFDNRIFFLISGKVQISKENQQLEIIDRAGDSFGEMSVIEGLARSATIRALEETVCLTVDASFAERLRKNEKLNLLDKIFTEVLASRLRVTSEQYAGALQTIGKLEKKCTILTELVDSLKELLETQNSLMAKAEKNLEDQ